MHIFATFYRVLWKKLMLYKDIKRKYLYNKNNVNLKQNDTLIWWNWITRVRNCISLYKK